MIPFSPRWLAAAANAARRECAILCRCRAEVFFCFCVPLLWMLVVWGLLGDGLMTDIPVAFVDEDNTPLSRATARALGAARVAGLESYAGREEALAALGAGTVYGALVIPAGYAREELSGRGGTLVAWLDETHFAVAGTLQIAVSNVMGALAEAKFAETALKTGASPLEARRIVRGAHSDFYALGNQQMSFLAFLGSALLPGLLVIGAMLGFITALVRENWQKSAGSWLAAARGSPAAALFGKLAVHVGLYSLGFLFYMALFAGQGGFAPAGSLAVWFFSGAACLCAFAAVAILMVAIAPNWRVALVMGAGYAGPALPFTGFSIPLDSMGPWARLFAECLPLTWLLEAQAQVWTLGASLFRMGPTFMALALTILVPLAIGLPAFGRRLRVWLSGEEPLSDASGRGGAFWGCVGVRGRPAMTARPSFFGCALRVLRACCTNTACAPFFLLAMIFYSLYYCWPYLPQLPLHLDVIVADEDNTPLSRQVLRGIEASPYFNVRGVTATRQDAIEKMQSGAITNILAIPPDFELSVLTDTPTALTLVANGAFLVMARMAILGANGPLELLVQDAVAARLAAHGIPVSSLALAERAAPALVIQPMYNTISGYLNFVAPIVFVIICQTLIICGTGMLINAWFGENPLPAPLALALERPRYLAAMGTPIFLFCLFWMLFLEGAAFALHGINSAQNVIGTLVGSASFSFAVTALALAVGLAFNRSRYLVQTVVTSALPCVFISGNIYPTPSIPAYMRAISFFLPTTPGSIAMLRVSQAGAPLGAILPELAHLFFLGALYFLLAWAIGQRISRREAPVPEKADS